MRRKLFWTSGSIGNGVAAFNERVLAEALDERTPFWSERNSWRYPIRNLDEFFMKRIAVLKENLTPERVELLRHIREKLLPALQDQADCFHNVIVPGLEPHGIPVRGMARAKRRPAG